MPKIMLTIDHSFSDQDLAWAVEALEDMDGVLQADILHDHCGACQNGCQGECEIVDCAMEIVKYAALKFGIFDEDRQRLNDNCDEYAADKIKDLVYRLKGDWKYGQGKQPATGESAKVQG